MKNKLLILMTLLSISVNAQTTNPTKTQFTSWFGVPPVDASPLNVAGGIRYSPTLNKFIGRYTSSEVNFASESWVTANFTPGGSGSYIVNSTSLQTASFNINGTGQIGGYLGIGTTPGTYFLDAYGSSALGGRFTNTAALGSASGSRLRLETSLTPTANAQRIGSLAFGANTETAPSVLIDAYAAGLHTPNSSHPSYLSFLTTPSGSATPTEKLRITTTAVNIPYLTAQRAVVTTSTGDIASSSVSSTELGYVLGVTSGIQPQIDSKASIATGATTSAATYSVIATNEFNVFTGTTSTWTLPAITGNTWKRLYIKNRGSGTLTVNANGGTNTIYATAAINTFNLNPGEAVILINDATYWLVQ